VDGSEHRRYNRSWKLAASLLGIVALVAANTAGRLVDVDAPWDLAVYFAVMVMVLLGGTLWLVPSSRVKRVRRPAGTTGPRH
jgi:uncharacterized membrane protein